MANIRLTAWRISRLVRTQNLVAAVGRACSRSSLKRDHMEMPDAVRHPLLPRRERGLCLDQGAGRRRDGEAIGRAREGCAPGQARAGRAPPADDGREPPIVIDGPFAETKEQLLGFYIVDAENLDEVLAVARELAEANPGGAYEIRPVGTFKDGKQAP